MTAYDDLCKAAEAAEVEFQAYRQRCWSYFGWVIDGLKSHSGVPGQSIVFLKWNGKKGEGRGYLAREDQTTPFYTLPGAAGYDESDGYWHLGICISLAESFLGHVSFLLCTNEQNGEPMLRMGLQERPEPVSIDDTAAQKLCCDKLMKRLTKLYSDPTKPGSKAIGFVLGTERPDDSAGLTQALAPK